MSKNDERITVDNYQPTAREEQEMKESYRHRLEDYVKRSAGCLDMAEMTTDLASRIVKGCDKLLRAVDIRIATTEDVPRPIRQIYADSAERRRVHDQASKLLED